MSLVFCALIPVASIARSPQTTNAGTAKSLSARLLPTENYNVQSQAPINSWKQTEPQKNNVPDVPGVVSANSETIISLGYGGRSCYGIGLHTGVDIPGQIGTPIYATADGVIGSVSLVSSYGKLVEIEHGQGIQTRYGNLSEVTVEPGLRVKRGQLIGLMGPAIGAENGTLHYEVRLDGQAVNPMSFLRTDGYLMKMEPVRTKENVDRASKPDSARPQRRSSGCRECSRKKFIEVPRRPK